MAAPAQIVEGMGADTVGINMGAPSPTIAKHNAGCRLMLSVNLIGPAVSVHVDAADVKAY